MKNVKDGLQSMLDNKIIIPTKINSQCRFCNFTLKEPCIDLGVTPLSNSYLKFNQVKKPEKKYPLQVFVCEKCGDERCVLCEDCMSLSSYYVYSHNDA